MIDNMEIGKEFKCGDGTWRCTDIGSRTLTAIRIDRVFVSGEAVLTRDEAEEQNWFSGPPYAVLETVFDEHDLPAITFTDGAYLQDASE